MNKEKLTTLQVPNEIVNSHRHFFGPPIKDFPEKFTVFKNLNLQTNQLINRQSKSMNFNSTDMFSEGLKNDETPKIINKMRTNSKSSKFPNLEKLVSELLFKDIETASLETIKSFLKFKLDLDEQEASKFITHMKKINPNASNQFNCKHLLSAIKSESNFESANPFENNILTDFSKKKSYDVDMNKVSEWIFKVAKTIESNNINLTSKLHELDFDSDGCVYSDDLRLLFLKLKLNLNTNDIENMINYFGYAPDEKVSIDHFSKNFLGHLNEAK